MEQLVATSSWTIAAEVELIYRSKVKASERPSIKSAADGYQLFFNQWDENKLDFVEQFKVALLNRANKVLGIYEVSTGGISGTVADPRLIFAAALKANACGILLCHNHPSGNLQPSNADIQLTQKIVAAGKFLDIAVVDHIIISQERYYSFADEGLL